MFALVSEVIIKKLVPYGDSFSLEQGVFQGFQNIPASCERERVRLAQSMEMVCEVWEFAVLVEAE